jgi:hypothetical protein
LLVLSLNCYCVGMAYFEKKILDEGSCVIIKYFLRSFGCTSNKNKWSGWTDKRPTDTWPSKGYDKNFVPSGPIMTGLRNKPMRLLSEQKFLFALMRIGLWAYVRLKNFFVLFKNVPHLMFYNQHMLAKFLGSKGRRSKNGRKKPLMYIKDPFNVY